MLLLSDSSVPDTSRLIVRFSRSASTTRIIGRRFAVSIDRSRVEITVELILLNERVSNRIVNQRVEGGRPIYLSIDKDR